MSPFQPPITPEQLAALPPDFQALLRAVIDHYERRIAELQAEIATLKTNARNSSKPPSSEHPHAKQTAPKPKSGRRRGGQSGHQRHERRLIPAEQCAAVHDYRPGKCRGCGHKLSGVDPTPLRHQVWELPEIHPLVTEHRLHRLTCSDCGQVTCGRLPAGVGRGQAGPRLIAFAALLMGSFRQSKRQTALFLTHLLNTPCSPGWVVAEPGLSPIRRQVEALLLRGAFSGNRRFLGMCDELWSGRANLWTFVDVECVEPTNNAAERALRQAVIWRKLSFGTQSTAGSRFVETMLTVTETCRQRRTNALTYVTQAIAAHLAGKQPPLLLSEA